MRVVARWLDAIREHCAAVAADARYVRIRPGATPPLDGRAGLDPVVHLLDAPAEERTRYVLAMDAINFGSGWFDTLAPDAAGEDPTTAMSRRLTAHARARGGPWTAAELRALDAATVAAVLGQDAGHPLMALYARALRELGGWLGDRPALAVVAAAEGSAAALAEALATGLPMFADPGFYKRAQITANDLELAGVARFADIDELTVFADNLLPHVLRLDGVLELDAALAARIDAGQELPAGSREECELRACTVVACDALAARHGIAPRVLDNRLWNRGLGPPYRDRPAHRTRTIAY